VSNVRVFSSAVDHDVAFRALPTVDSEVGRAIYTGSAAQDYLGREVFVGNTPMSLTGGSFMAYTSSYENARGFADVSFVNGTKGTIAAVRVGSSWTLVAG